MNNNPPIVGIVFLLFVIAPFWSAFGDALLRRHMKRKAKK